MNNLNLGLALGVSGMFLNCATLYRKGAIQAFAHTKSRSDLNDMFEIYASYDDVCDLSENLSESSDSRL
ncbi:hypothetical protein SteCoe_27937 [Stentor coeruleus]|uniref:Uncharacterized protein n=1 Tax=Stentor coeruleus TaxID=5963 RepID=A0A1R2B9B8_9CILI|nr:hypothetical protein SteCoe_27937 [Stentor coeruleus]